MDEAVRGWECGEFPERREFKKIIGYTQKQITQKSIKIFIYEIYSKPPKKNYRTNKTNAYHIDDIWSLERLNLRVYGPENNRGYRYVLLS